MKYKVSLARLKLAANGPRCADGNRLSEADTLIGASRGRPVEEGSGVAAEDGRTTAWTTGVAVGEEVTKDGSSATTSVWGPVWLAFEGTLLLSPIFLLIGIEFPEHGRRTCT